MAVFQRLCASFLLETRVAAESVTGESTGEEEKEADWASEPVGSLYIIVKA